MDLENLTAKEYAKQNGIDEARAAIVLGKMQAADLLTMAYNWQVGDTGKLYESAEPLFITLSALEALSIEDAIGQEGGEALAIGKDFIGKFLTNIDANIAGYNKSKEEKRPKAPLIVAMPSDAEGLKLAEELTAELSKRDLPVIKADITGAYATINEALQNDKAKLKEDIETAQNIARLQPSYELKQYQKLSAASSMQDFIGGIKEKADTPAISTGFKCLDNLLDGGLYPGLYFMGAISSLGKTSLALQIVDQIAKTGQDCLIFSLEMAKEELIAKSISRITYQKATKRADAKTTRGILAGVRYDGYTAEELQLIEDAETAYSEYASHIYISEGIGNIGVAQIKEAVKKHIKITGKHPVVLIDYLQILAPYDTRLTDKQNTDKAVLELKRLSRDYKTPVIGISSFNRDNYSASVNMAAFKESGAIEYSADVLIGLQYAGLDDADIKKREEIFKKAEEAAREGEAQGIQIKVLKNRNGSKGSTSLSFYPMFNYFSEAPTTPPPVLKNGKKDIFEGMRT